MTCSVSIVLSRSQPHSTKLMSHHKKAACNQVTGRLFFPNSLANSIHKKTSCDIHHRMFFNSNRQWLGFNGTFIGHGFNRFTDGAEDLVDLRFIDDQWRRQGQGFTR